MSTRGRIGLVLEDGKVASIYQHWDSYPKHLGRILLENYKDVEKIGKLVALGDCSSVREEVDIPEGMTHTFDSPLANVTVAYGRDCGETGIESRVDESESDFWKSAFGEYGYLFKDGTWYVATSHAKYDEDGTRYKIPADERSVVELTEDVCEREDDAILRG